MAYLYSIAVLCLAAGAFVDAAVTPGVPICTKNSNTSYLTTRFTIKVTNNQQIGDIFGLVLNNAGQLIKQSGCMYTTSNVVVSGVNTTYYTIESKVDLNNQTNTVNGCGITKASENGKEVYRMIIGVREAQDVIRGTDSNYQWSCIKDEATDTYLSTSVEVLSPNLNKDITAANPNINMNVIRQVNNVWVSTSTCTIGETIGLQVIYDRPTPHTDYLTPWGIQIFDLKFGQMLTSATEIITLNNGCINTNRLGFTNTFVRTSASSQAQGIYQTTGAVCKRYGSTNKVYFVATVSFCSGAYQVDQKCINSCTATGRKRRQAEDSDDFRPQQVFIEITVIEKESGKSEDNSFQMLMVAMIIVVFACLGLVVGAAICMFLRSKKRGRTSSKKSFTNSSSYVGSNSESSIPPKF